MQSPWKTLNKAFASVLMIIIVISICISTSVCAISFQYVEDGECLDNHSADTMQQTDPGESSAPPTGIPDIQWIFLAVSAASILTMTALYKRNRKHSRI